MIEHVVAALRAAGLDPAWEDVADTLWLAAQLGRDQQLQAPAEPLPGPALAGEALPGQAGDTRVRPDAPNVGPPQPAADATPRRSHRADRGEPRAAVGAAAPPGSMARRGLAFQVHAGTALPGARGLGNALRPLKRRLPSGTARVLDEEATAEQAASQGVWGPVLRPALTRWLDLALVIDQSPSMAVWERTVAELRRLLERHGSFRDVRTWQLDTDGDAAVLHPQTGPAMRRQTGARERRSAPRELVDPTGRRLIAIVSDGVAPAWFSGSVPAMLAEWGKSGPVVLVNLLPQRLWRHTAAETEPAGLRALGPGTPNAKLQVLSERTRALRERAAILTAFDDAEAAAALSRELGREPGAPSGAGQVAVPVVTLERQWLAPWATLVAGAGGREMPSAVMWAAPASGDSAVARLAGDASQSSASQSPVSRSPAAQVREFRSLVSPAAFRLASYLSAVPVTLPIMRLVQQAMVPGSTQAHLAEVLLGGILERTTPVGLDLPADRVDYDFREGTRELLLDALPGTDAMQVIRAVGDFIGSRAGRGETFPSLLLARPETMVATAEEQIFALVSARTLRRFGGEHALLADYLAETAADVKEAAGEPAAEAAYEDADDEGYPESELYAESEAYPESGAYPESESYDSGTVPDETHSELGKDKPEDELGIDEPEDESLAVRLGLRDPTANQTATSATSGPSKSGYPDLGEAQGPRSSGVGVMGARVYVSSTIADLAEERRAVLDWLRLARHQAVDSYLPDSDTVRDNCLDDVCDCDLYVLILGHRYGFQPPEDNPEGLSITHLEFRRAGECGIPRVALLRTSIPDVRLSDLQDPARAPLVLRFRDEVAGAVRPAEFSDLKGLIQGLSTGIQGELAKLAKWDQGQAGPVAVGRALRLAPRPVFLAGRAELLAELEARLAGEDGARPRVVALHGLGGAGKTSVAVEYAYRHLDEAGVCWQLPAEDPTVLAAGFGELAAQLGADSGGPVAAVHGILAASPALWLLVFDNAPDRASVARFIPPAGPGRVLITSRNQIWPPGQALDVPVLDPQVAAEFLVSRTGDTDQRAALELAGELGGLPLALEQAAAYVQASGESLARYLALFRNRRPDLLARGEPTGYSATVATTWRLAFEDLQQAAPGAAGLLRLLAFCAPEAIPLRLLLQPHPGLAGRLGEQVAPVLTPLMDDRLAAGDAIAALRRYSLISPPATSLFNHLCERG